MEISKIVIASNQLQPLPLYTKNRWTLVY